MANGPNGRRSSSFEERPDRLVCDPANKIFKKKKNRSFGTVLLIIVLRTYNEGFEFNAVEI